MTSHMFWISKKGNWTNDGDFIVYDFLGDNFFLKNVSRNEMIETLSLDPVIQKVDIAIYRINHRLSSECNSFS